MGRFNIKSQKNSYTENMSETIVVLGGTVKADKKADFLAFCKDAMANTKAAAGCEWAKACVDKEDSAKFAIFQKWKDDASRAAFAEKVKSEGKLKNAMETMLEPGSYKKRVFAPYSN